MDPIELDINRRNTMAFILAKPVRVILTPVLRTKNVGSAGFKNIDQPDRAEQVFRIIEAGSSGASPVATLQDGKQRDASFLLLGPHDAAIAVDDHWVEGSRTWSVEDIIRSNEYESRALVSERGK